MESTAIAAIELLSDQRICKQCGGSFIANRKHQRFCTPAHKEQYHLDKRHGLKPKSHTSIILVAVQCYPNHTAPELATIVGLTNVQVSRRVCELEKKDIVQRSDEKRWCVVSKQRCVTWREVE